MGKIIISVIGTRPNIMKIAPLDEALAKQRGVQNILVHTGQHYDFNMSDAFFRDLQLRQPDHYLGVGSGSLAEQTSRILSAFEKALQQVKPDLVVVPGDVNSTLACALAASQQNIPVAHIEAGLRSFDRSMPEEINRLLTDRVSSLLFTTHAL